MVDDLKVFLRPVRYHAVICGRGAVEHDERDAVNDAPYNDDRVAAEPGKCNEGQEPEEAQQEAKPVRKRIGKLLDRKFV